MYSKISEQQYYGIDPIFRVIVHDHPRVFGTLLPPSASHALTMCWRSDLIEPVIVPNSVTSSIWIGVDQRFASVALTGNTLLSMVLNSSLLDIIHFEKLSVVLCETQALIFNHSYTLRKTCNFKDIAVSFDCMEDHMIVKLLDGESEMCYF